MKKVSELLGDDTQNYDDVYTPKPTQGLKATATTVQKEQTGMDAAQQQASVQGAQTTPDASAVRQTTAETQPATPPKHSYANGLLEMMRVNDKTPEQIKKAEKRERTNNVIRSVGDGLSALARLYFASQGGTVTHDNKNDLTYVSAERRKLLESANEKAQLARINGYLKAQQLDEEARKNDMTNAENVRYHNMIGKHNDNKDNLDRDKLDQKEDKDNKELDLKERKQNYYEQNQDRKFELDDWYKRYTAESGRIRANKTGYGRKKPSSGDEKQRTSDRIAELYETDPEGLKKAERKCKKKSSIWTINTYAGQRQILKEYDRTHGKKSTQGSSTSSKPQAKKKKKRPY